MGEIKNFCNSVSKMAQWVNVLAAKPGHLSSRVNCSQKNVVQGDN